MSKTAIDYVPWYVDATKSDKDGFLGVYDSRGVLVVEASSLWIANFISYAPDMLDALRVFQEREQGTSAGAVLDKLILAAAGRSAVTP